MRKSISPSFRAFILNKYPGLATNPAYLRFFRYLCFGDFFDEATDQLVIPTKMIAVDCCLKAWDRNFNGKQFLLEFQRDVIPAMAWTEPTFASTESWHGKAREVLHRGFDQEMLTMLHKECVSPHDDQVDLVSGQPISSHSIYTERKQDTVHYETELAQFSLNETQAKILDYLRRLNVGHLFIKRVALNQEKIEQAIAQLPATTQQIQFQILANVHRNPRVYYLPSSNERTCRLSPRGASIVGLRSEVRKALSSGWVECDLRSSQFAILAARLNAPISEAFIQSGESIWRSFYQHTHGLFEDPPKTIKKVFKEAMYSICFGKSVTNLTEVLNKHGLVKLLSHPIIQELLVLRKTWFLKIREAGGAFDVWDQWQALDLSKDPLTKKTRRWEGAVAASVIRSIEMEIISPIFEVAMKHGRSQQFGICLFQHDGATISFKAKDRKARAQELLKDAVERRARELGVTTVLEFTDL